MVNPELEPPGIKQGGAMMARKREGTWSRTCQFDGKGGKQTQTLPLTKRGCECHIGDSRPAASPTDMQTRGSERESAPDDMSDMDAD